MHWFQAMSANMNPEAQRRALVASMKAALLVFTNAGDNKMSLIVVKTAPALRDVRKVAYSAELTAVGFSPRNRNERHSSEDQPLKLNKFGSVSVRSDLKLPSPKCTQSRS